MNIFNDMLRPRLSPKIWIKLKELNRYWELIIWVTASHAHKEAFSLLRLRIVRLIKSSGFNFTFLYLKEVMRLVIRALAGSPEPITPLGGVMVKRDHNGLPTIIPLSLRKLLLEGPRNNNKTLVALLSLISVFRVFPTSVKPSLATIISPFAGLNRSIDSSILRDAVVEISRSAELKLTGFKLIHSESAGANTIKSGWASSIDALAFIYHPKHLLYYSKWMFDNKRYWFMFWPWLICAVALPFLLILKLFSSDFARKEPKNLGRLAVVYDQAGKARVVAITNWWIQLCLYPLHKDLFRILRDLRTDGTFDQHAPFERLISKVDGTQKFSSFDLSAATDRLPIDIQVDILNLLKPGLGTSWRRLLSIPWIFKGRPYFYAVGQPMGAYSSWAMLAFTHHVLVRVAALKCGMRNFDNYAVLGDDIVIYNDAVASAYANIMAGLGVGINMGKSVISKDFAEFAKTWRGPQVEITPLGPGLTLRLVRAKYFLGSFLAEATRLKLMNSVQSFLAAVRSLDEVKLSSKSLLAIWSTVGLRSFLNRESGKVDASAITFCFPSQGNVDLFRYSLWNAILQVRLNEKRGQIKKLEAAREFFKSNWWRIYGTSSWPLRLLEAILKLVGPGPWMYWFSLEKAVTDLQEATLLNGGGSWSDIHRLANSTDVINVANIDWRQKDKIVASEKAIATLLNEFERSAEEASSYFSDYY